MWECPGVALSHDQFLTMSFSTTLRNLANLSLFLIEFWRLITWLVASKSVVSWRNDWHITFMLCAVLVQPRCLEVVQERLNSIFTCSMQKGIFMRMHLKLVYIYIYLSIYGNLLMTFSLAVCQCSLLHRPSTWSLSWHFLLLIWFTFCQQISFFFFSFLFFFFWILLSLVSNFCFAREMIFWASSIFFCLWYQK